MTEDEHIKLMEVGDLFYIRFSKLVAEHLAMLPASMEADALAYLGDRTSVYGAPFERYLPQFRSQE